MNTKEVPVLLLTGYLGSGKTTLVNQILANKRGIKFAVIVNDIGEVNIDADLIQKGGVVGKKDDSLVALQNGCICCTLKMDLVEQIGDILKMQRFDYIVIEASGICEPEPIAQTICSIPTMGGMYTRYGICRLDSIVTVVDALRMQSEFACGDNLTRKHIDEEDIENLIIQQIEFCNIILLNKASEVKPEELGRIKQIIKTLQPAAEIIECDYGRIDLDRILNTRMFNFERVATSAGWIREIERQATPEEEREAHCYGHHDHEEHEHHMMKNMNIIMTRPTSTDTITTTITTTKAVRWKNMASKRLSTTADRHSTSTSSTSSSLPAGPATSSVPKACATSATIATCRTSSNRPACRRS